MSFKASKLFRYSCRVTVKWGVLLIPTWQMHTGRAAESLTFNSKSEWRFWRFLFLYLELTSHACVISVREGAAPAAFRLKCTAELSGKYLCLSVPISLVALFWRQWHYLICHALLIWKPLSCHPKAKQESVHNKEPIVFETHPQEITPKTHQASFWVSVCVSVAVKTGNTDRNPKIGLVSYDRKTLEQRTILTLFRWSYTWSALQGRFAWFSVKMTKSTLLLFSDQHHRLLGFFV